MRIHERESRTRKAENELGAAIANIIEKHELSTGEALRIVNAAAASYIGSVARYTVRHERHPDDPEMPGGLE